MALQIVADDMELDALAEEAGLYLPPDPDDPRACSHAWNFQLNPEVIPAWLIDATAGRASAPEVPGVPQAFRFDAYIDWVALAASHRDELEIVEDWSATVRCLEIVEELRARGYDARIQAEVFILRQEARPRLFFLGRRQRRLIFGVQAGALSIYGSPDAGRVLEEYQTDLTEALNEIPTEPGCLPMHAVLDSSEEDFACIYFTA